MLTLEERERRAYIEGRVEEARLLAETIDSTDEKITELTEEVEELKNDAKDAEAREEKYLDEVEALENKVADLRAENEHIRELHLAALVGDDA